MATPGFLPGEFYGQRSLASYSPWDRKESDTTAASTAQVSSPNGQENALTALPEHTNRLPSKPSVHVPQVTHPSVIY